MAVADIDLGKAEATAEEIRRINGAAFPYQLDVTDPPGVGAFIDAAAKALRAAGRAGKLGRDSRDYIRPRFVPRGNGVG